jgi:beta-carotene 3-hydroxylase
MNFWINVLVFVVSFLAMEFVAWFTHKYIMHGFLWSLHHSHHHHNPKRWFEKNDWFSALFAIPSCGCIVAGLHYNLYWLAMIGFGMSAYGLAYFLVHDIFVHQRFKLFKNANNAYLRAVRRAHKIHHKNSGKENGASFGFIFVARKYFRNN